MFGLQKRMNFIDAIAYFLLLDIYILDKLKMRPLNIIKFEIGFQI